MRFPLIDKILSVGFAMIVAAGAVSCSTGSGSSESSSSGGDVDSVGMELRIGRTTQINKVNYTLTGPNGFSRTGSIDVSKSREIETSIKSVPVGSPYTLALSASSTDGNVTCSGSKSGIGVSCPGDRERDEKIVKLTCTRRHLGREWGDRDWRDNARTFYLAAEFKLVCQVPDGGVVDSGSDAKVDAPADVCVPTTCAAQGVACGPVSDGCGGVLTCPACSAGFACVGGQCICQPRTACPAGQTCGTAPDGCGGTIACGLCTNGTNCNGTVCVCPAATCGSGQNCGTVTNACGNTSPSCGTCGSPNTCGGGGTANVCGCTPTVTTCPSGQQCGQVANGCGGFVQCGTCPTGQNCNASGQCTTICPSTCSMGAQCGTQQAPGCPAVNCGTCTAPAACDNATNTCKCVPATTCPAGQTCGTAPDGCGGTIQCGLCASPLACNGTTCVCPAATCGPQQSCGTVTNGCGNSTNCGTCPSGQSCDATNKCICNPVTTCPAGQACGQAPNGCGGFVQCGTCPTGQSCNATGQCISNCIPTTCAAAGKVCGSISDGCSTTLNCGSCPAGTTCRTDGTACDPVVAGCDTNSTTTACLQSRPAGCFQCAVDNGCLDPAQIGGTCEQLTGNAPATCQSVLATSAIPTETQVCMKTLHDIFTSGCAADGQETPCLCGATDAQACLGGSVTPLGAVYPVYQCDLGPAIADIKTNFNDLTRGGGMGNTIIQCAASLGCPCF
jgi:hypothetical protein